MLVWALDFKQAFVSTTAAADTPIRTGAKVRIDWLHNQPRSFTSEITDINIDTHIWPLGHGTCSGYLNQEGDK